MQEMSPLDEQFRHHLNAILETWQQTIRTALEHGQVHDIIKPETDCQAAALFIVSAWEGCLSIAKNKQSPAAFKMCMAQLHGYIRSLM
jgi:TetR/AcrR family transcriptional regulator, transcriptional repressor for nem operon